MTTATGHGSVEQYLDEMFDRLAGTGAAGRRLLSETESHLLDAVEEGRARGLDAEAAEREALDRFGTVTGVVRHVPAAARSIRTTLRRLLSGTWLAAGVLLLWWGGSGVMTWLLGWPWTWLLIATDRFGTQAGMCGRPWVPSNATSDCLTRYRGTLNLVLEGGDRDAYPWLAVGGVLLLAGWLLLRRVTVLGTRAWAPEPAMLGLALALPFGLAAPVLLSYGVAGLFWQAQHWTLSYLTAGLFATAIAIAALRHVRSSASPERSGDRG
ncbi:permease prefix domain 1-containing protein [Actinoplanes sp. M2I2]|uniref:permease prefix domain 1-containing protein n=1 Tax=Actinoplanes sp. M2I2 TaxID=1734444 RepID=UPI00202228C7|nr:permease prefix domain 1-containing protein [Actinoplanes sp. M2I2]